MAQLHHASLNANLKGTTACNSQVWHFRGLQYGIIPSRYAAAVLQPCTETLREADCTDPRCPQAAVDPRHLLRIPEAEQVQKVAESEFECLNLDVAMPALAEGESAAARSWPVMVWIYGGSQTVTFGSSASGLCDPTKLVATAAERKQPILVITLNYRLNIFAFGDGSPGARNLALSDQRIALDYVIQHIGGFGGDPENITLAGQSAGAVYVHAHMVMGAPIRQSILQSGSLHLSPPLPADMVTTVLSRIRGVLSIQERGDLKTASVADLLAAQAELGIVSLFLQMEPALVGWEETLGSAQRLLIGDCEYESNFLRTGIDALTAESISRTFDNLGDDSATIKALYGIVPSRPVSCRTGALDFLHDVRFTIATEKIAQQWRDAGQPVFRYLVDEANPWQPSSRAHHAVDLPLLFGSFDLSFNPGACRVSALIAQKWIDFVSLVEPWEAGGYFAFGPLGESKFLEETDLAARRRMRHCLALSKCSRQQVDAAWKGLAAGNISLQN